MTVAVDTNVVLDIAYAGAPEYENSRTALRALAQDEDLVVGEVVIAELASRFDNYGLMDQFLIGVGIAFQRSSTEALHAAGAAFKNYARQRKGFICSRCGKSLEVRCPGCDTTVTSRQHILPDFMIGAHALVHAGRLLTRDRGYYATYFPDLVLV